MTVDWAELFPEDEKRPSIEWSHYQKAVFDFVENGSGNAVVEALAGSGKTSCLLEALNYIPSNLDIAFIAFNKSIANELKSRAPSYVSVSTLHGLGFKQLQKFYKYDFRSSPVNSNKMKMIFDKYLVALRDDDERKHIARELDKNWKSIRRLCSLFKSTLMPLDKKSLIYIIERYVIIFDGLGLEIGYDDILIALKYLLKKSIDSLNWVIDFDDMILAPATGIVPCQEFDFLFVDEAQDMNVAQIEFISKSVKSNGRVVAAGDTWQSCYSFRGADSDAIPNMIEKLNAITLPLNITYRCPVKVVYKAREYVPHLEHRIDAEDGIVGRVVEDDLSKMLESKDMILSRTNARLVPPAFELIRKGISCVILGRDIGNGLNSMIGSIQRTYHSIDLEEFMGDIGKYQDAMAFELLNDSGVDDENVSDYALAREKQYLLIVDKLETIKAIAGEGCRTVGDIKEKISAVFRDEKNGIVFSTIHKAKGGEADRVFVLGTVNGEMKPHPMAKQDWEIQQELNLMYIATTRAKKELYFVDEGF